MSCNRRHSTGTYPQDCVLSCVGFTKRASVVLDLSCNVELCIFYFVFELMAFSRQYFSKLL